MSLIQTGQLDDILLRMISNIQKIMTSLYAIQTLVISTMDRNPANRAAEFREIRQQLLQYWEKIVVALKKCNVLGNEATKLATVAKTSKKAEVLALMQKRLSSLKQAGDLALDLIRQHDISLQSYSKCAAQIKPTIAKRKLERTSGYSNGGEAMNSFDTSCKALKEEVVALHAFLKEEIMTFTKGLAAAERSPGNLALDDAVSFIDRWKRYQPVIVKTMTEIEKYCDAITIPPASTISPASPTPKKAGCIIF